jgi:hypothetical protein
MILTDLRPGMLVYYDAEQVLLKIDTIYAHSCTVILLMQRGKMRRRAVRVYLDDEVAGFTEPPPDLVRRYGETLV